MSAEFVCRGLTRCAAALVNGTIYIYGGQATTRPGQTTDRWNNNFLTLSVREDWATDSPKLEGLPIPDGPPKVANGYVSDCRCVQ